MQQSLVIMRSISVTGRDLNGPSVQRKGVVFDSLKGVPVCAITQLVEIGCVVIPTGRIQYRYSGTVPGAPRDC